jgi:hypothetical protein
MKIYAAMEIWHPEFIYAGLQINIGLTHNILTEFWVSVFRRSTQPLTEMSTRNLKKNKPGGKVRPACRADNLAAIC